MNKYFVPYEIAKRLKRLGFNELCLNFYANNRDDYEFCSLTISNLDLSTDGEACAKPLWQQVIDWLEREHKIYITVLPYKNRWVSTELCWYYILILNFDELDFILCDASSLNASPDNYDTKEKALEAGILEVLTTLEERLENK